MRQLSINHVFVVLEINSNMPSLRNNTFVRHNQLLCAFEPEVRNRLDPYLEVVSMKLGEIVCEAGGTLQHVYFPEGADQADNRYLREYRCERETTWGVQ